MIILGLIFFLSGMLSIIPMFFIFPYFLGKKFDRIMQKRGLSVPKAFGIIPAHIVRTGVYAVNIIFFPDPKKHPNGMKQYKRWFGNFCFREHASNWDKIQAWYLTSTISIMLLALFLSMLISFINYLIGL